MYSTNKIGIIGLGTVGSSLAFSLIMSGIPRELVLIDRNEKKTNGEALDMLDAASLLQPTKIYQSDYEGLKDADLVAITCGLAQKPGQTRLDLVNMNVEIYKEILPKILKYINEKTIILVITNPMDILTYVTLKISNLPKTE